MRARASPRRASDAEALLVARDLLEHRVQPLIVEVFTRERERALDEVGAPALQQQPDDPAGALQAYERARVDFGSFIVGHARALGAYMQAQLSTPEERAMAERYRSPEAIMRETAIAPRRA